MEKDNYFIKQISYDTYQLYQNNKLVFEGPLKDVVLYAKKLKTQDNLQTKEIFQTNPQKKFCNKCGRPLTGDTCVFCLYNSQDESLPYEAKKSNKRFLKLAFIPLIIFVMLIAVAAIISLDFDSESITPDQSSVYILKIISSGPWRGSIMTVDGSGSSNSKSVDGTGIQSFNVIGNIVSVSIQNYSDSGELIVQLSKNGQILKEERTTASYGIVAFAYTGDLASNTISTVLEEKYEVRIVYSGEWHGSIGDASGSKSIEGFGPRSYEIEGIFPSVVIQKMEDNNNILTVQILKNGTLLKEESTSASYGVAMVTSSDI